MKPGKKMLAVILGIIIAFICVAVFGIGDTVKGVSKMRYGIDIRGGVEAVFKPQSIDFVATEQELEQAREVIEVRMDAANITDREVTVDQSGGYIIVRFPWKSDETDFNPEDAISELGAMSKLTFRDEAGNVLIEGKNIKKSAVQDDGTGTYVVDLTFDDEGVRLFEEATGKLIGHRMGIYMDEEMISNPMVESRISGGRGCINNIGDFEAAKALSQKINSGALPFSLQTTSFSTISPSLGNNALYVMVVVGAIAFLAVCIYMIGYYKEPGLVASVTLVLQMVLQLLAISVPQYTLTLPGIAGIILSLGMAVDANVIISERVAEGIKAGCSLRMAVKNGYQRGFTSVLDGNITTAIVAVILMVFGSGAMLSFGYTLLVGMIVNVLVGVTVSKQLQLCLLTLPRWNNKKYFREKKEVKVKGFYKKKWLCGIISGVILVIGLLSCAMNGIQLDTQFTGGAVLNYTIEGETNLTDLQEAVEAVTSRAVTLQETQSHFDAIRRIEITLAGSEGITPEMQKAVTAALTKAAGDKAVTLEQTYAVEPYIGEKAMRNSGIAIGLSAMFIMLYVWLRFKILSGFSAGVTALVALFHDLLVAFFTFTLFKIPLNDAFTAVILTIIGYSINDTIVVYDRIRENKGKLKGKEITELVDLSISQVLARSVNTSITTGICVLMVLAASVMFHIESIFEFSLPMFLGLMSGCYSSVCIASILWAMWEKKKLTSSMEKQNIIKCGGR